MTNRGGEVLLEIAVRNRKTILWLWAIAIVLIGAGGCQQSTPPGADIVFGKTGNSSYTFLHWKEGLRILIWFDVAGEVSGSGSGSTSDPVYRVAGRASASDGRRIDWRVETADGRTATFSIDGRSYDLSKGVLFLVRTKGGDLQVQQLDRDLSAVGPTNESCEAFAETDPDISRFIREAGGAP